MKEDESIIVAYCATKKEAGTVNFEESLNTFGYKGKRLGSGLPWKGWVMRMKLYVEYLETLDARQIVVLSDADDVLACRRPDGLHQKFVALGSDMVVGAEVACGGHNCLPLGQFWKYQKEKNGIQPELKYSHANGGSVMGRAGALLHAYNWILDHKFQDDQLGLCAYINHFPQNVALDVKNEIFFVAGASVSHSIDEQTESSISIHEFPNKQHIEPYFVHFAGTSRYWTLREFLLTGHLKSSPYSKLSNRVLKDNAVSYHTTDQIIHRMGTLFWVIVALCIVFFIGFAVQTVRVRRYSKRLGNGAEHT